MNTFRYNRLLFLSIIFTGFMFVSCKSDYVIDRIKPIPEYKWNFNDRIPFKFTITDTVSTYRIMLKLRITGRYEYSNIWVKTEMAHPDNKTETTLKEYIVATPEGHWTGNGLGDFIDNQFIVQERLKFRKAGEYTITFNQYMRVSELEEIMDVGLAVIKEN